MENDPLIYRGRLWVVQILFGIAAVFLLIRLAQVQFFYPYSDEIDRIKQQQMHRYNQLPKRGSLLDRNGEQLAVSTDTYNVYIARDEFLSSNSRGKQNGLLRYLTEYHKLSEQTIAQLKKKPVILLATNLTPAEAKYVSALRIAGLWLDKYYTRYYPAAEAVAQLVGFVDPDGKGLEGMELLYDERLAGSHLDSQTLQDGKGRVIKILAEAREHQGEDIYLSIDLQLQYLAYHHLLNGCRTTNAKAGTLLTLDIASGEILSLVQYPSFNPNNRKHLDFNAVRNRAFTDVFEPGSTIKPLVLAAVLEDKKYSLDYTLDTSPGYLNLGGTTVRDARNYGKLPLMDVISKSSNVGMIRLSQDVDSRHLIDTLYRLGLGRRVGTTFPGEREGYLPLKPLKERDKAALSYGYGLSVTPIQLLKAYGVLANGGYDFFVSLVKTDERDRLRVLNADISGQVMETLKKTVSIEGTGRRAMIEGYSLAGKTGTIHKSGRKGYEKDKYVAAFVGVAPTEAPRYVSLVILDEPIGNRYYGGEVAAPVFAAYTRDLLQHYGNAPRLKNELSAQHNR